MAISFGDAALAFAGGAAEAYNKDAEERRQSDLRIQERAQEMLLNQQQRMAETKFAEEYKQKLTDKQFNQSLKSIEATQGKPGAQFYYMTQKLGYSREDALNAIKAGKGIDYQSPKDLDPDQHIRDLYSQVAGTLPKKANERFKRLLALMEERKFSEGVEPEETAREIAELKGEFSGREFADIFEQARKRDIQLMETKDGRIVAVDKASPNLDTTTVIEGSPEKPTPFTLSPGQTRYIQDEQGTVIEVASVPESEKEPTIVESATYFRNNKTGETIRPTRSGNQYFHGDTPIDIRQYTPVTDDDETRRAERVSKSVEALKARQTALGNLEAGLTAYKQTLTEGTTGATGAAIDVGSALGATITGVGELLGVAPVTPEEREKLFMEAGVDIEDFISGDMAALRGMNVGQAKQLVYSLAGILKEDGDLARTSVADVQNAASMIKDLSSTDRGVGALRALEYTLQTKKASVFQQTYQAQGVDPRTRTQAGINLLRTTLLKDPNMFEKAKKQIMVDPTTGEMSMLYADGTTRTLDQIIMSEGVSGQLRPTLGVRADYNR